MSIEKKTYGETVGAREYAEELRFHQYIPQADAIIEDEIRKHAEEKRGPIRILDLGMGPGRLTTRMSKVEGAHVVGLDNSPDFVKAAKENALAENIEYVCTDFLEYSPGVQFDVIFMQGVWHHVPLDHRAAWLKKISSLLTQNGVLIIGDEFIPDYETEDEREHKVGLFYLHIIGEAIKSQNFGLARNECLNFLADTLHNEESRGYFDEELLIYIQEQAVLINNALFSLNEGERLNGHSAALAMIEIISAVRYRSKLLEQSGSATWVDRGDYKVSTTVLDNEIGDTFTRKNRRDSGPVDFVGGMSVLTYVKS